MLTKIAKDFYWEMSHRLPFHKGPCRNIHGHSYKLRVEIEGELNNDGMVMDYYDLKQIVMPIIDKLDHSFAVDKNDELMLNFLKQNNFKFYLTDKSTTAENLVEHFFELLQNQIKEKFSNVKNMKLRLFETEDVYAEISRSL